jgi:hypothetical protein
MSDTPVDDGTEADSTESVPDLLAEELSPVVHPDYESGSPAGPGGGGGNARSDQDNGAGDDESPRP